MGFSGRVLNYAAIFFRFYGGYDIEFGICVSEHILEEGDEWEVC